MLKQAHDNEPWSRIQWQHIRVVPSLTKSFLLGQSVVGCPKLERAALRISTARVQVCEWLVSE